jgi:hypothetical protein
MSADDTRTKSDFDRAPGRLVRTGTLLSGMLPGLLSLCMVLAAATYASADGQQAGAPADPMKQMMEEQLARIPTGEEGVNSIMSELSERLTLTATQQAEIRPTIEQTVAAMEDGRNKVQSGEMTPMAMAMAIQMAGQKAAVQIEPILTEEQLVVYKQMRQDQRREMMQAMQKQRAMMSGAGAVPAGGGSQ